VAWIVIIAFWTVAIRLWIVDGPKTPLIFIALWVGGLLLSRPMGLPGYVFMSYQAVLAVILLVVERYKSAL